MSVANTVSTGSMCEHDQTEVEMLEWVLLGGLFLWMSATVVLSFRVNREQRQNHEDVKELTSRGAQRGLERVLGE